MRDARCGTLLSADDGNRGIGSHVRMEGLRVDHVHKNFEMEIVRHQFAERPSITILHPPIRADEAELTALHEASQRSLDERNVEIGAVIDRAVACPVFCHALCANMTETSSTTVISEQGGKENQHDNDERFCPACNASDGSFGFDIG